MAVSRGSSAASPQFGAGIWMFGQFLDRYAADGISASEAGELDTRADVLSQQVFYDRLTTSAAANH